MSGSANPRAMLTEALEVAQSAVLLDSENKVPEALQAYCKACDLLSHVLDHNHGTEIVEKTLETIWLTLTVTDDRRKLNQILETYTDRIRLLQALNPRLGDQPSAQYGSSALSSQNEHDATHVTLETSPLVGADDEVNGFLYSIESELRVDELHSYDYTRHLDRGTTSSAFRSSNLQKQQREAPLSKLDLQVSQSLESYENHSQSWHKARVSPSLNPHSDSANRFSEMMSRQRSVSGSTDGEERRRSRFSNNSQSTFRARASSRAQELTRARSNSQFKSEEDFTSSVRRISIDFQPRPRSISGNLHSSQNYGSTGTKSIIEENNDSLQNKNGVAKANELLTRPYRTMRLLLGTFASYNRTGQGIFITKDLHIPHSIWEAKNTKIKGEDEKIQAFQMLIAELTVLGRTDRDDLDSLLNCLDTFEKAMDSAQTILARKLGTHNITSLTIPIREDTTSTTKKVTGKSLSRLLKGTTLTSVDKSSSIVANNDCAEYEGNHILFQSTTAQLFQMAQLIGVYPLSRDAQIIWY